MLRRLIALAMVALVTACRNGWLVVEPVATSVQRPSQVAVYLSVRSGETPVTDLTTASFSISEDGQRLDATAVDLSLLDRKVAAAHHTVLLLDTSNIAPGRDADAVTRAAEAFVRKVMSSQSVSVYAFDGGEALRTIAEAARSDTEVTKGADDEPKNGEAEPIESAGAQPLKSTDAETTEDAATPLKLEPVAVEGADRSRDLHGAVVRGLDKLEQTLSRAVKPVRVGTLVVFTRGPDLAGRVSAEQVDERLDEAHAAVVAVSVGTDEGSRLQRIGRDGVVRVATVQKLEQAFEQAADRVLALEHSHYLLAYCSPARAGERELSIEVKTLGSRGEPVTASLDTKFDARGFTSGCDAKAAPRFVVTLVPGDRGTIPAAVPEGVEGAPSEAGSADEPGASPAKAGAPPAAKRRWRPPPARKKPAAAPPPSEPSGSPATDFEP
jgi:hypothetical protein